MKKVILVFFLFSCALYANPYGKCVGCHGAKGEKVALGKSKIIKDMTKEEIRSAMTGYRNSTYGGEMKGLMVSQSKKLTDYDIDFIANKIGK